MKKGASVVTAVLITIIVILIIFMVLLLTGVVDLNVENNVLNSDNSSNNEVNNNNGDNNSNNKNTISDDDKYSSIIDEYKRAMNDSNFSDNMDNYSNINSHMINFYHMYKKGIYEGNMTINYTFYDINKDNNNEMIVTETNGNIIEIYTYDGSKANAFFKSTCLGERCNAFIYDNGIVYFYGSGGAAIHGLTFYKIGNDGYSRETEKDFSVEIKDGVYSVTSGNEKLNFKSDQEIIDSVVKDAKKVDLSKLQFREIK